MPDWEAIAATSLQDRVAAAAALFANGD
jgi:hypothetical protein